MSPELDKYYVPRIDRMVLTTDDSGFELGDVDEAELVINADTCTEGFFKMSEGTLDVNADLTALRYWRLGPEEPALPNDAPPVTINVAAGKTLSLPRTGGTCGSCP